MNYSKGKYCYDRGFIKILLFLYMVVYCQFASGAVATKVPALIPMPQKIVWNGQKFKLNSNSIGLIQRITAILPSVPMNLREAYTLNVCADSAVLTATTPEGLFRGRQTFGQLTFDENGAHYVAGCSITDWPAFRIRGYMQDVGRNYMPLSLLKEQIDVMAAYKFNLFHFHVTDNPGWRLQSKKYPQLSSPSSMSRWPGNYYTQEDFLNLVNYCKERYITLVPEFDVPGHCEAFRKAFALDSMSDPRVQPILLDLIDEVCSLVPKEQMPWLHLGTDEVWEKHERPASGLLEALEERVKMHGRTVVVWRPGQAVETDQSSVTQLWSSSGKPKAGHPYIDSRLNYLNHLDPLAGIAQLYFDRICNKEHDDSLALGGILCCWNDNKVTKPYDILVQNPVYPGMLTYSETSWKGQPVDLGESYLAIIPGKESVLYDEFLAFEERLVAHRDLYFKGKPFPYVKQSAIEWSLIGPFDNKGNVMASFPVENAMEKEYSIDGQSFRWKGPVYGGTIHIRHFFGFPSYFTEKQGTVYAATNIWSPADQEVGCWIGFHDWSRSAGRRGGPFPEQGQWHITDPKVWLNGEAIASPVWNNPGLGSKTDEIPFSDENYFFRKLTKIILKKGWNKVLLKVPQNRKSWKWMFTFVPVRSENGQIRELEGLKYSVNPQLSSGAFKTAPVFGEHMVFQQNKPIEIFGTSAYNDHIRIVCGNHTDHCNADPEGKWKLILPKLPAGGPYRIQIFVNDKIVVDWKDILIGEVWFCSGQSNMEFKLNQSEKGKAESDQATDDRLRLLNYRAIAATSDVVWDSTTQKRVNKYDYFEGSWQRNSPVEAADFSAIAYYFGKELREKLQVPVGLIEVAVGGAPGESFIDQLAVKSQPQLTNLLYGWFRNERVMEWCRQRAQKNCSAGNCLMQRHPYMPSYVFDAGIASFQGFQVKGVLWYQGESNADNSELYKIIFPELIGSWRQYWKDPELPFIFAQLSSIQRPGWENFRDNQRKMALTIPHTAMVVTSDLGDSLNVHPIRKKEVGHRFVLQALKKVYGKNITSDGPMPVKAQLKNSCLEISFDHAGKLKTSDSKLLRELEIAGKDGFFYSAEGKIQGNRIIVNTINQDIMFVRYGWKPFSRGNLVSQDGLPASTFSIIKN
jgi:hypothetical protein